MCGDVADSTGSDNLMGQLASERERQGFGHPIKNGGWKWAGNKTTLTSSYHLAKYTNTLLSCIHVTVQCYVTGFVYVSIHVVMYYDVTC